MHSRELLVVGFCDALPFATQVGFRTNAAVRTAGGLCETVMMRLF